MSLAGPSPATVLGVLQSVTYVAVLLTAGLAVFLVTMLPDGASLRPVRQRLAVLTTDAAAIGSVAALLLVPATKGYQADTGLADAFGSLGRADLGSNELLVAAIVTGTGVLVAALLRRDRLDHRARLLVVTAAAAAAGSMVLVGHTRTFGPTGLVWTADIAHLVAAAVWFGGLVGLAASLPRLAGRELLAAQAVARFSAVAAGSLVALVAAGAVLTWRILGSWDALVESTYGNVLLLKVGVAALVVLVAAWNRFGLLPRLREATGHAQRLDASRRVRRAVGTEAAGLVVVLLVTGFLVQQMPAGPDHDHGSGPELSATVEDVTVIARLDQDLLGRNTLFLRLEDDSGEPYRAYANPSVQVVSGETPLDPKPAASQGEGRYVAALELPYPDEWAVEVTIRTDRSTERSVTFELDAT